MRVLLVNPRTDRIIGDELPQFVSREIGSFPPLGLLHVASFLRRRSGHKVSVLDMDAERMTLEEFGRGLASNPPDIVGITAITHNLIEVVAAAVAVKSAAPKTPVCIGGPHVEAFPAEAIGLPSADFTVRGEGERAFLELLNALEKGETPANITGVSYKIRGAPAIADTAAAIEDLDELPFPAWDLVDGSHYHYLLGGRSSFATIASSRGCPFKCVFCGTPHGRHRACSAERTVAEMRSCIEAGTQEIHFVDDTFNIKPDRIAKIAEKILSEGLRVRWSLRARVNGIDAAALKAARKAGCARVHFGVETGTDAGLAALKKGITLREVENAFSAARQAGIASSAYFLIGCPHEKSEQDVYDTIEWACALDPDFAMFNALAVYPHTELHEMAVHKGLVREDAWREFALNPTAGFKMPLWEEHFTREELADLLTYAYRRFYWRPKAILRAARNAGSVAGLRRLASAAFAMLKGH